MAKDALGIIQEQVEILRRSGGIESKPRYQQIKYLSRLLGITPSDLARGMILGRSEISARELAEFLGVTERNIYRMKDISSALKIKNMRERIDYRHKAEDFEFPEYGHSKSDSD